MIQQARSVLCLSVLTLPNAGCGTLEAAAATLGVVGGGMAIGVASAEKANLEVEKGLQAKEAELQAAEQRNLDHAAKIAETELAVASKELELLNRGAGHKLTISGDIGITVRAVTPDGSVVPATIKSVSVSPTSPAGGGALGAPTPTGMRDFARYLRRDRRKDAENPEQAINPLTAITVGREVAIDLELGDTTLPAPTVNPASDISMPQKEESALVAEPAAPTTRWGTVAMLLVTAGLLVRYSRRSVSP